MKAIVKSLFYLTLILLAYEANAGSDQHDPIPYTACEKLLMGLTPKDLMLDTFVRDLARDPVGTYRQLELQAEKARQSGSRNYPFHQRKPFLLKIIVDLNGRLTAGSVLELPQFKDFHQRLSLLRQQAIEIFRKEIPSDELNSFVLRYIETMDALFRSTDPSLTGTYHRDFAESLLKSLLTSAEGTHLFFTPEAVTDEYLWHIRPAATYLHWMIDLPPFLHDAKSYRGGPIVSKTEIQRYLDGLHLDFEETAKHDAGHSWYMKRQDEWLFKTAGYSRLELVTKWTRNKDQIFDEWSQLKERDPELGEAARYLISEIVHERGYQFYLPILKQQFSAKKWIEIVGFKRRNKYWGDHGITDQQFQRLEEARLWLVDLVDRMLVEENLERIEALNANESKVLLKSWNPVASYTGTPIEVEAKSPQDIRVTFDVPGVGSKTTSLYEISLVLAPKSPTPLITPERIPIASQLSKVETYKLERLLNLQDKKIPTAFTVTRTPDPFTGKVTLVDKENRKLHFVDELGRKHEFDLTKISLQPASPDQITIRDKYINLNPEDRFVSEEVLHDSYEKYRESVNADGPSFVTIKKKIKNSETGEVTTVEFELGMIDTSNPVIARAVSSLLTRSLEDAKYTNGGYLPPKIVERVQAELVSPYAVNQLWGKMGRRFVLSRAVGGGRREIVSSALVGESRDNVFFFTSRFNNLKHSRLEQDIDFNASADGDPNHKWFDKFRFPKVAEYKPKGYHHFANFVVEREGVRGLGLARLMIEEIVKNYSREYIHATGAKVRHSQRLLCGKGFWQIGDPPWLARMESLGFFPRLGAETFHMDVEWDKLAPTYDRAGKVRDHVSYNESFGLPQMYEDLLSGRESPYREIYEEVLNAQKEGLPPPPGEHLLERIPAVIDLSKGGRAKFQYFQLVFPFERMLTDGAKRTRTEPPKNLMPR